MRGIMTRPGLVVCLSLLGFLAMAPQAAAQAIYGYAGNNFEAMNITDEDPPAGTYDTSMQVTGAVTFASPLAPNLVFGDVTADVIAFVLDDGRGSIRDSDPTTTDFSFFVGTDATGVIVSWAIFAEAQEDLGGQVVQTHQIVSRTGGAALDRGIILVDDLSGMGSVRLGTDIAFTGTPTSWALLEENYILIVAERSDDVFTPGAEFLLSVEVVLENAAGADLTSVSAGFGGTVLDLTEDEVGRWEAGTDFADFAALESEISGAWTVTLVGGALASTNSFDFDTTTLSDADFFPTPTNVSPGNGATGVAPDVVFSWNDPTGGSARNPDVLVVEVEDSGMGQGASNLTDAMDPEFIALDTTSWDPPSDLEEGVTEFDVLYASVDDGFVSTIDVMPPGTVSWRSPNFFPSYPANVPFLALASETLVQFTVPEPTGRLLAAAVLVTLALTRPRGRRQPRRPRSRSS